AAPQSVGERHPRQRGARAPQEAQSARRRGAGGEDGVQERFHNLFQGGRRRRFPQLNDRDNLWRLLVVITARKALDQLAHEHTRRQGGGALVGESPISPGADEVALEQVVGDEPSPEVAAKVAKEYRR